MGSFEQAQRRYDAMVPDYEYEIDCSEYLAKATEALLDEMPVSDFQEMLGEIDDGDIRMLMNRLSSGDLIVAGEIILRNFKAYFEASITDRAINLAKGGCDE